MTSCSPEQVVRRLAARHRTADVTRARHETAFVGDVTGHDAVGNTLQREARNVTRVHDCQASTEACTHSVAGVVVGQGAVGEEARRATSAHQQLQTPTHHLLVAIALNNNTNNIQTQSNTVP